ncbi:MAG: hypothetical protein GY772_01875 [bacterium]|jgi:hypothetical protein|nr:hypothetical protein [bacterium]MDP7073080.1 hypothetical protein [Myxococcota bacterium]MDP7299210.1 hypothetical protein [Myxococcota bacterium]HJO23789.1 hypothetical protein [Myxococcota bacterium]
MIEIAQVPLELGGRFGGWLSELRAESGREEDPPILEAVARTLRTRRPGSAPAEPGDDP